MDIVILYGTTEGQTRKIAETVAAQLRDLGHGVRLIDTADKRTAPDRSGADRVILAAPVHERRHPEAFEITLTAAKDALAARPTLMLSVSLKAAFPEGQEEAEDYLIEMKMRTGLDPSAEMLVAGAVRPGSYDYFQSQIVRHVALNGQDVALSDGVQEFTDWPALAERVEAFVQS